MSENSRPEWASEAADFLDDYLGRVAELARAGGDDADEIVADLRAHIVAEVEQDADAIVDLPRVRKAIAALGTPEDVTGAEPYRAKDPPPMPIQPTGGGWARKLAGFLFYTLAVAVPIIAILTEMALHLLSEISYDPVPSAFHAIMLLFVPLSLLAAEIIRTGDGEKTAGKALAAFALNGYAVGVASVYLILYLPVMLVALVLTIFLIGFLGLTPLWCVLGGAIQMIRLYKDAPGLGAEKRHALAATLGGIALSMLVLAALEGRNFAARVAMEQVVSEDAAEAVRGESLLRWLGAEDEVLLAANGRYWAPGRSGIGFRAIEPAVLDRYQALYFKLTGRDYAAEPLPDPAVGSVFTNAAITGRGFGEAWDDGLGGTDVGERQRDLALFSSSYDVSMASGGDGTAGPALAYVEWTMEFKNGASWEQEARGRILLPSGAVASRLTLWIGGEEREAAFGGRSRVREAYEEVAVVRRRDPALLTTMGPDRLLLQCFPVPAGKTMKVKVGFTVPLALRDGKALLVLPRFTSRNFDIPAGFEHNLWAESRVEIDAAIEGIKPERRGDDLFVLRGKLPEELLAKPGAADIAMAAPARETAYKGRLGKDRATLRYDEAGPAKSLVLVIDGSAGVGAAGIDWQKVAESLPAGTRVNAVFAGEETVSWRDGLVALDESSKRGLAAWLDRRDFEGGHDPVPALARAWEQASSEPGALVVWVHGILPAEMSPFEDLLQWTRRRPASGGADGVTFLGLAAEPGLNVLEDWLGSLPNYDTVTVTGSPGETLAFVARNLAAEDMARRYELARDGDTAAETMPADTAETADGGTAEAAALDGGEEDTSAHLVRLAAAREIGGLLAVDGPDDYDKAMELAVRLRLVTPVSGAVVLERKEQYERHGLDPGANAEFSDSIPTIPEPGEWALLAVAGLALVFLLKKRRAALKDAA